MSVSDLTRRWLTRADRDRRVATELARHMGTDATDAIGFHCQQAAEKYIKAVLVHTRIEFPKTHDLGKLITLAGGTENGFGQLESAAKVLTPFAVEMRYGDEDPEAEMMQATVEAMEHFRRVCLLALEAAESENG